MQLLGEFDTQGRVVFEGDYKEDFNKRLMLLEHEIEGTMRRGLGVTEVDADLKIGDGDRGGRGDGGRDRDGGPELTAERKAGSDRLFECGLSAE